MLKCLIFEQEFIEIKDRPGQPKLKSEGRNWYDQKIVWVSAVEGKGELSDGNWKGQAEIRTAGIRVES